MGKDTEDEVNLISQKATRDLATLLKACDVEADWVTNDWKEQHQFAEGIAKTMRDKPGWLPYVFPDGYSFDDGRGDDIICVFLSGKVDPEIPERIANLLYNLGADLPGTEPEQVFTHSLEQCPSCGADLDTISEGWDVAVSINEMECKECNLRWEVKYDRSRDEMLISICPLL